MQQSGRLSAGYWNGWEMVMATTDTEETVTLRWRMDDESWSHWAQGRGRQTASDVVRAEVNKILNCEAAKETIRKRCARLIDQANNPRGRDGKEAGPNEVEVRLSSADWGEVCQLVGEPGDPVSHKYVLASVIIESESWQQSKHGEAMFNAGWIEDLLISAVTSAPKLTHTQTTLRLGTGGGLAVWAIAAGSIVGAVATWVIALRTPCG